MGTQDDKPDDQTGSKPATDQNKQDQGQSHQQTGDDGKVVLSQEDYNNLIAKRDANFNKAKDTEDQLSQVSAFVADQQERQAKETFVDQFLENEENKKKYPHVERDDLLLAGSPEDVEAIAKRIQRKAEDVEQSALEKASTPSDNSLSVEDADAEIEKLDPAEDPDAFDKWAGLELRKQRK